MAFDLTIVKRHPYITGAIVIIGGIILFLLIRGRGSSGGDTIVAPGNIPYPVTSAVDSPASIAQAQMGVEKQRMDFELAKLTQQQAGELSLAQLQATTSTTQQANQLATSLGIVQADVGRALGLAQIDASVRTASLDAALAATLAGFENQRTMQQQAIVGQYAIEGQRIYGDLSGKMIDQQTILQGSQIAANVAVYKAGLDAQTTVQLADRALIAGDIAANRDVKIAAYNADAAREIASRRYDTVERGQDFDLIGAGISAITSLF